MNSSLRAHSVAKGEAIQKQRLDCFVALLLAMTRPWVNSGETRVSGTCLARRIPSSARGAAYVCKMKQH